MDASTVWWLLAGTAVAVELVTGTFYLLMLALGFSAAALAAMAGASTAVQTVVASVVGGGAVVVWGFIRSKRPKTLAANANPDVNLDIGETIHVAQWSPDGTAQVHYRGAQWTAMHRPGHTPASGPHRVTELVGNRLLVDKL